MKFKHLILASFLLGHSIASAQLPPAPNVAHRYLFVVDTSLESARLSQVVRQTVYDLLITSMFGQMRAGDSVGIWTYDDDLHTDKFPEVKWEQSQAETWANQGDDLLKQEPAAKKGDFKKVMAPLLNLFAASPSVTVLLINDGSDQVKGTPVDRQINGIYRQNASRVRRARKPFVTIIVASGGKIVAYRVNEGGTSIEIPSVPDRPPPEFTLDQHPADLLSTNLLSSAPAPLTIPPVTGAVETTSAVPRLDGEIPAAALEKPLVQTELPALTNRDSTLIAAATNSTNVERIVAAESVQPEKPPSFLKEDGPPKVSEAQPAASSRLNEEGVPPPITNLTSKPLVADTTPAFTQAPLQPNLQTPENGSVPKTVGISASKIPSLAAPSPPIRPVNQGPSAKIPQAASPPIVTTNTGRASGSAPPAVVAQAIPRMGFGFLAGAICFLLAALIMVFWLGRRTAGETKGSLISRSLEGRDKP